MPNYETLRNSGQNYNLLILKSLFCFKNDYFIPIQSFRVCKLLYLKTLFLLRNIFVTTPKSLFTKTYQRPLLEEYCLKSAYSLSE